MIQPAGISAVTGAAGCLRIMLAENRAALGAERV
jgi:hypothetical protein